LKTPIIRIPFGVEKEYQNLIVKIELPKDKEFSKLIKAIEQKFCEILEIDSIKSQLRESTNKSFGDLLTTKIIRYKDRANIKIDRNNSIETSNNIKKGDKGVATLLFDSVWKYGDNYTYKIKLIELALL
jgi:ribosomal protein L9